MSDIQFNLLNRRSAVSGYTPTGLKSGELFVQMADSQILFKNNLGETVKIGSFPSGDYVATGVTGSFVATSQTGKFATLDESNYLRSTEIPNITGDVCINAGSNISTVYKIQGQPVANTQPVIGQTLQYDGTSWVPGSVPAGGNGGGGLVYYFNDAVAADLPTGNLPASLSGTFELGRTGTANQLAITSNTLSQVSYDSIVGFVTDVLDPSVTSIPAGLFDFNIWASSSSISQTILQLKVFKYNGSSAPTLLATSDDVYTYDGAVTAQYIMSIVLPQTTLLSTDRLYIQLLAKATTANKTITLYFGGNTPSHVHTTIPSVGGSGLVKVINGIMQNPASKLVDADISETAAIAGSKIESGYFALANKTGLFLSSQVSGCSVILGGSSNFICTGLCNVVILGGNSLTGIASNTAYARDLCACGNVVSAGSIAASGSASICGSISIGTTVFNSLNSNLQINNAASNIINSSSSTSIGGPVHSISNSSNCSIIAAGCYHQITANSNGSAILGGANNTIVCSTYSAAIGGQYNGVRASDKSITIGGCANTICCAQLSSILNGSGNFISGTSSTICNVSIIGCNITGTTSNTLYVNNICAFGGKYYGDGSALTGLATGSFITTSQTGAFGAAGYVTQESTGILVGTGQTGNFVTTSQTGVFALAAGTGSFITTAQTGVFALAADTGSFVTTTQTGVFALAADTGSFVTTSQTGSFIVASQNNTFNTINASNLCVSGGYLSVGGIEENITVCSAAAGGAINFDVCSSATMYYINNSTANFFINLRSNSSTALNSVLETNKTLTVTFLNTNGSTAYALTGVSIDGTGRSIKWLNGTGSYPAGNTGSIDSYSITAVKTGNNLYTVLGSQGKFV